MKETIAVLGAGSWGTTLANLLASSCALLVLAWLVQRPLDYWDWGFQAVISVLIELIVLGVVLRPSFTSS